MMIKELIANWEKAKPEIRAELAEKHPESYKELVTLVVKHIRQLNAYTALNHEKIHEIDDGHYQGTALYVIPEDCYQPDRYWAVKVGYGSCSGCDTLQSISEYDSGRPNDKQLDGYMTLALHIVQSLSEIGKESEDA